LQAPRRFPQDFLLSLVVEVACACEVLLLLCKRRADPRAELWGASCSQSRNSQSLMH
jgi:hypothetical protein